MRYLTIIATILLCASTAWGGFGYGRVVGGGARAGGGTPTQIVETYTSGDDAGSLSTYTIGQSFASSAYPLYSISVYVYAGTGTLTCRVGSSANLSTNLEELSTSVSSTGWKTLTSSSNPTMPSGTAYIACQGPSGMQLSRRSTDVYASGMYLYESGNNWNVTQSISGRDLLLRVSVLQ